jgi:hypothetical protein
MLEENPPKLELVISIFEARPIPYWLLYIIRHKLHLLFGR